MSDFITENPHEFDDEGCISLSHTIFLDQAKEKWCPEARRPWGEEGTGYAAANRAYNSRSEDIDDYRFAPCIADRCMFWQWHDEEEGYCAKVCSPADHARLAEVGRAEYRERLAKLRAEWDAQQARGDQ